jgi:uncharacterized membrane protein
MDGLGVIGVLLLLALLIGSVLSFVNLSNISDLKRQLAAFKTLLIKQNEQISTLQKDLKALQEKDASEVLPSEPRPDIAPTSEVLESTKESRVYTQDASQKQVAPQPSQAPAKANEKPSSTPLFANFNLEKFLMGNGLLWLGALILAIGGVFLAKYSIEAGLFPPALRILLGAGFGVLLVVVAEYLYRHPKRFQINSTVISAALASGGVITCFAMVLVAFDFYAYMSATFAFVLLAIISLAAAWLSLRFGPILAAIGVIGAYAVPALVSTGSNNVLMLLMYICAVSFSAVWIHQIVQKAWIWWLGLAGHFAWFAVAIGLSSQFLFGYAQDVMGYQNMGILTVFSLISAYLFVLLPILGWDLRESLYDALSLKQMLIPRKEQLGIFLPVLGMVIYALGNPFDESFIWVLLALSGLLLATPIRHSAFDTWPFLALGFTIFVYLNMPSVYDYSDHVFALTGGYLLAQVAALSALVYAFAMMRTFPSRPAFALLLVVGPLSLLSISYALSEAQAASILYPLFALELGAVALVFAFFAMRAKQALAKVSFLLLANGALGLIFTMLMSASTLTLAIAIQIALMAVLSKKYTLPMPAWLYKAAMLLVMARLTFAPWLPEYAGEHLLGLHWSLIIYPMVFAVLWFARKHIIEGETKAWFTGALLHLLALFITTESSYWLTGSYPDFDSLSFQQAALLGMNWLILAMIYLWRSRFSSRVKLYHAYAIILALGAAYTHLQTSLIENPFISEQAVGENPFINYLIILWLVPAIVLAVGMKWQLFEKSLYKAASIVTAILLFLYINGVVRLAFTGQVSLNAAPIEEAELYTYSILWLLIAIGVIVFAQTRANNQINRVGFAILAAVVLKAFLIDMSNLEGLYRALSFIGLGLSLVGIGWLFQRFKKKGSESLNSAELGS